MDNRLIDRFYDISSDFNDSLSLIAILIIINKKSELTFPELKNKLSDLEFDTEMIEAIEEIAFNTKSRDMGRLIRLISPIDKLFVREKPRDAVPSIITEGRKKRLIKIVKNSKSKKKILGLFGEV